MAFTWVLDFVDRNLHENHKNWYPTKIKPPTVLFIQLDEMVFELQNDIFIVGHCDIDL